MVLTIILTFWITCALLYVSKELARPFSTSRSTLILLDLIFAPYFLISDIIDYWKELNSLRERFK